MKKFIPLLLLTAVVIAIIIAFVLGAKEEQVVRSVTAATATSTSTVTAEPTEEGPWISPLMFREVKPLVKLEKGDDVLLSRQGDPKRYLCKFEEWATNPDFAVLKCSTFNEGETFAVKTEFLIPVERRK